MFLIRNSTSQSMSSSHVNLSHSFSPSASIPRFRLHAEAENGRNLKQILACVRVVTVRGAVLFIGRLCVSIRMNSMVRSSVVTSPHPPVAALCCPVLSRLMSATVTGAHSCASPSFPWHSLPLPNPPLPSSQTPRR
jgi:hypothetical protein